MSVLLQSIGFTASSFRREQLEEHSPMNVRISDAAAVLLMEARREADLRVESLSEVMGRVRVFLALRSGPEVLAFLESPSARESLASPARRYLALSLSLTSLRERREVVKRLRVVFDDSEQSESYRQLGAWETAQKRRLLDAVRHA